MATSTYRTLTNMLIRRINESEISESDFASASGVHALCKDTIQASVDQINQFVREWPFNLSSGSQTLTAGTEAYSWPSDYKVADMDSFYIQKDDSLNVTTNRLRKFNKDEYYRLYRDVDEDSTTTGRGRPLLVIRDINGFIVTPSPDQAYVVNFKYFTNPSRLSAHDDTVTIPSDWDHIIILGALYHMNLFRENAEGHRISQKDFEKALEHMRDTLVETELTMEDTRLPEKLHARQRGFGDI